MVATRANPPCRHGGTPLRAWLRGKSSESAGTAHSCRSPTASRSDSKGGGSNSAGLRSWGMNDDDTRPDVRDYALEVGSGLASASAGFVLAGPAGAVAGAFIGPTFTRVGRAIVDRYANRDRERSMTALGYAALVIAGRLERGDTPRPDWVPAYEDPHDRGAADELAEATLKAAATDPEDRKLPFYGALLGNLAFDPDVSRFDANRLVRIAATLTYRQYVVLSLAASSPIRPPYDGVELEWTGEDSPVDATWALLQHECQELEELRLLAPEKGRHNNRVPTRVGERVIELMGLDRVGEVDRAAVGTMLAEKSRQPPLPH